MSKIYIINSIEYYTYANLLHPDVYVSARFIESQVVKIGVNIFNGVLGETVGISTVSGTESITTAMMAYRNRGYTQGITHPEL
jgi:glutamate/tyrosine decarboxylase-like PLP-dependent enzyme